MDEKVIAQRFAAAPWQPQWSDTDYFTRTMDGILATLAIRPDKTHFICMAHAFGHIGAQIGCPMAVLLDAVGDGHAEATE